MRPRLPVTVASFAVGQLHMPKSRSSSHVKPQALSARSTERNKFPDPLTFIGPIRLLAILQILFSIALIGGLWIRPQLFHV